MLSNYVTLEQLYVLTLMLLMGRLIIGQYRLIRGERTQFTMRKEFFEYIVKEFIAGMFSLGYILYIITNYNPFN